MEVLEAVEQRARQEEYPPKAIHRMEQDSDFMAEQAQVHLVMEEAEEAEQAAMAVQRWEQEQEGMEDQETHIR